MIERKKFESAGISEGGMDIKEEKKLADDGSGKGEERGSKTPASGKFVEGT